MADLVETKEVVQEQIEKASDKDQNFANLRRQKDRAEQMIESERAERLRLQEELNELKSARQVPQEQDIESDDPYIDKRTLDKILAREREVYRKEADQLARSALEEQKKKEFMPRLQAEYSDFNEVFTDQNLEKLQEINPIAAGKILKMTDPYEQRERAYELIKANGIHKKAAPQKSGQELVDQNKGKIFYTPNTASSGGATMGDFSESGRKQSYGQMKELMKRAASFSSGR